MKSFRGKVLFLDRSDINTDEIIPAKYLTEISKEALRLRAIVEVDIAGEAAVFAAHHCPEQPGRQRSPPRSR